MKSLTQNANVQLFQYNSWAIKQFYIAESNEWRIMIPINLITCPSGN